MIKSDSLRFAEELIVTSRSGFTDMLVAHIVMSKHIRVHYIDKCIGFCLNVLAVVVYAYLFGQVSLDIPTYVSHRLLLLPSFSICSVLNVSFIIVAGRSIYRSLAATAPHDH